MSNKIRCQEEQVCLHVCFASPGHARSNRIGKMIEIHKHNTTRHEMFRKTQLFITDIIFLGEIGFANSSNVVRLLPDHLPSLHDGGGALQHGRHEVKLEGPCSGETTQPKVLSLFHRTLRLNGTPPYFSLTKRHKNCWPTSLQPLSSPLSLTCLLQVLCCPQIVFYFPNIICAILFETPRD